MKTQEEQRCHSCHAPLETGASFCARCGVLTAGVRECERHPVREAGVVCVVCGRPLCDECRSGQGVPALCDSLDHAIVAGAWAKLFHCASEFAADCVARNVEAQGIPTRIFSNRQHVGAVTTGASDIVRVFVKGDDLERARHAVGAVIEACTDETDTIDEGDR